MRQFLEITKGLSDETRVRALLSLRGGELCLCQIIEMLRLSPSTVSKHMDVLCRAGLVERRKDGLWHFFRLAGRGGAPAARRSLRWVLEALKDEPALEADSRKLRGVRRKNLKAVTACYRRS